jgi:hypothetical protein
VVPSKYKALSSNASTTKKKLELIKYIVDQLIIQLLNNHWSEKITRTLGSHSELISYFDDH